MASSNDNNDANINDKNDNNKNVEEADKPKKISGIQKMKNFFGGLSKKQKEKQELKTKTPEKKIEPLNNPTILLRQLNYERRHPDPNYFIHMPNLNGSLRVLHCTIKGPENSEYSGGFYHFAILLSQNHPFSPPKIMVLNPNGRFYVGVELCIAGITDMHPENYLASYKPGQICIALQSLLTDYSINGVGFIEAPFKSRIVKYAKSSPDWYCHHCNTYLKNVTFGEDFNKKSNATAIGTM